MGRKTVAVGLPVSLFDGFVGFFPYNLVGGTFVLSARKILLYSFLLCVFIVNVALALWFTSIPKQASKFKVVYFLSGMIYSVSLFACLLGIVWHRDIVNLPFIHFEFGLAYLRSVGFSHTARVPPYYNIGPYLMPMLIILPDAVLLKLDTFRVLSLLNAYLIVYFIYLMLFRIFGFLKVLEGAILYCKNTLCTLGDGVHYLGKTHKIESLLNAFNHFCTSCLTLSEVFTLNFLTAVSIAFVSSTSNLYMLIVVSQSSLPRDFVQQMILSNFLELLSYIFILIFIVHLCATCVREVNEFNEILYQQMIDDRNDEILHNRKLNLHLVMKRGVEFTACSFFSIDYPLIHSIVAAASTYLIVLIQFSPLSSPASEPPSDNVSTTIVNNVTTN